MDAGAWIFLGIWSLGFGLCEAMGRQESEASSMTIATNPVSASRPYRGRLAPSPTGLLHIGHARTFWIAQQRAIERQGTLIFRNEDLDLQRSRPEFAAAM